MAVLFLLATTAAFAQLPSVTLKSMDGKEVNTATLNNGGKPFIISFFATWCKPCNRELDAINEVYPDWQEETGVKVIAISIDQAQNINKVKPLVDGKGWEYEVLLDPNSDFRRAMGVNLIPHVFIIDGNGKIVESRSGYTEGGEAHLIEKVREILAAGGNADAKPACKNKGGQCQGAGAACPGEKPACGNGEHQCKDGQPGCPGEKPACKNGERKCKDGQSGCPEGKPACKNGDRKCKEGQCKCKDGECKCEKCKGQCKNGERQCKNGERKCKEGQQCPECPRNK